ncbi:1-phosphofructokinase family hexose kinase [Pararhodobacter aggregans]|uniref:Phosphofructokinase n=1 Tax=Pararhodobacter aggregans TaxID=404875 RepID=A0A2T7UJK0_9RHOB|nr:PfkB family carbohydrate kinase [Pararhodobacter aggregans]PTW96706.1 6-phosphofructokinase [Pararhodobacter aggregans]PVE44843.1 sugar kinase [Pararhodobacter aggregans]
MHDLLTVTLNPALDVSSAADRIEAGPKLRLDAPVTEPGGGGINVARAAAKLGGHPRAIAALGGVTGARFAALMAGTGVSLAEFPVPGETRQNLAVTDRATGGQFRLQMPGPDWTPALEATMEALIATEAAAIGPGAVIVLSGSQPPGMRAGFPQALARRLGPAGRLIVDTSGPALDALVSRPAPDAAPLVLRMDQAESEGIAGRPLPDIAASLDLAQALVARGAAACVVIARGAEGSVLATARQRLHARPPHVEVVSKIGAGDSFTAAFALSLAGKAPGAEDWAAALLAGTAAAAAAVMTPGSELCRASDAAEIAPRCTLAACD